LGNESVSFLHPSRPGFRFTVLAFVGLLPIGSYFAYDTIGAMVPTLIQAWGTNREAIGWLYTVYSLAAIPSLIVGGLLIDRIGTRRSSLIFSLMVVIGAVIVATAKSIAVASIGRAIFGAGSETLIVVQSAMLARWFRDRELALSFGITLSLARLGTLFSFNTVSLIAVRHGYKYAFWAAVGLCVLSFLANIVYFVLDRRGERYLGLQEAGAGDKIVLADVVKFQPSYWFTVILCVTFYSAIFPFTDLSTDLFHDKWGLPLAAEATGHFLTDVFSNFLHMFSTAAGTTSIIILASMICAPFAGGLVDRIGKRSSLMILGSLLMIPCYLFLGFTRIPPYLPMMALGAAFVLVPAALWPAVPLIVDKERTGTAFGVMTMLQNIGLALFPWLNGRLRDATHDYTASMLMFAALGVTGLFFALMLKRSDLKAGSILDRGKAA
jgi:MFS family permease